MSDPDEPQEPIEPNKQIEPAQPGAIATAQAVEGEVVEAEEAPAAIQVSAVHNPLQVIEQWGPILDLATAISQSRLAPSSLKSPQQIAVVILKGLELNIPPMTAVQSLHVVKGKVGMSAELMRSLVYQRCPGAQIIPVEQTATRCALEGRRGNHPPMTVEFTIQEAQQIGLVKGDSAWATYPADMLYARATSRLCRRLFPDIIMGCYTQEEVDSVTPAPNPHAAADPNAPQAGTRDERSDAEKTAGKMYKRWKDATGGDDSEWWPFVAKVIGVAKSGDATTPDEWSKVAVVLGELEEAGR